VPDFPQLPTKVDFPPGRIVDFPLGRQVDFPTGTIWGEQTVFPTDDTYVISRNPNTVTHTDPAWDAGTTLTVGYQADPKYCRGLYKFDVSTLPPEATGYQLRILTEYKSGSGVIGLYSVTDDSWTEGTATWNNQPAHIALLDSRSYVGSGEWMVFQSADLDTFIKDQIAGDGVVSFKLIRTSGSGYQYYCVRHDADINKRPRIYLPAP